MRGSTIAVTAVCACCALVSSAQAQIARGVVVDAASGEPVRGAFVQILNEHGQQVAAGLAGQQGEFLLRLTAGQYTIKVDRIGQRTSTVPLFSLGDQEVRNFRIDLEVSALQLPELRVSGQNRCESRPDASRVTAEVWEEARKALALTTWTENNSSATFSYRNYRRTLDRDLRERSRPTEQTSSLSGKRVFHSVHPDTLALHGYIRQRPGMNEAHGPDAELLLSSSFLSLHCFRLERRKDRPGLIGLAFEPIRGRKLPDIKGALWLDEQSAELRFVEFGYVNKQYFGDQRYAGGRTTFHQLPNGAWIVSRWYIRTPILDTARSSLGAVRLRVTGAIEQGGEVLDVRVAEARSSQTSVVPRR